MIQPAPLGGTEGTGSGRGEDGITRAEEAPQQLSIESIQVDHDIQIRAALSESALSRYEAAFDRLPPITVFDTEEGLLLGEGFHRLEVARRRRKTDVWAFVRTGDRADAAEYAILSNARNGEPLTAQERDEGIRRLRALRPGWSSRVIANAMSLSHPTVLRVFAVEDLRREAGTTVPAGVTEALLRAVARLPADHREPLLSAAKKRGWSNEQLDQAVRELRSAEVPDQHKAALLAGEADPLQARRGRRSLALAPTGDSSSPAKRELEPPVLHEGGEPGAGTAGTVDAVLLQLAALARLHVGEVIAALAPDVIIRLLDELPSRIEYLAHLLEEARGAPPLSPQGSPGSEASGAPDDDTEDHFHVLSDEYLADAARP